MMVLVVVSSLLMVAMPAEAEEDHFRLCTAFERENGINGCGEPPLVQSYRPVCEAPLALEGATGLLGTNGTASTPWQSCPRPEFVHVDLLWPAADGTVTFTLYQAAEEGDEGAIHYQVACSVSTLTPAFVGSLRGTSCTEDVHQPLDDERPWKRMQVDYRFGPCTPVVDPCAWGLEAVHLQWA